MTTAPRLSEWLLLRSICLCLPILAGCVDVHMPKPATGPIARVHDLADHVEFLTQPALKGRKSRSIEAGYVRQYIRQQFEACQLSPWGKTSSFDQSFGFGTNVVGVLRGSDPSLADQVVLLCAHYDSLGVVNGKTYPGAANNASGVAVLLHVAERLASEHSRPRRTIAFAALDCGQERFLGAFAFTMRKDFDPTTIAAALSFDMLGRENFGVIPNALIVVGSERYPEIRSVIQAAATQPASQATTRSTTTTGSLPGPGLRIMPAGSDLVPPISNYFALEQWHMPVLFFTNGLYFDYHKPTDTAEKLHYDTLKQDADVIVQTVRNLADRQRIPAETQPTAGDREELEAIRAMLDEVLDHADELDLTSLERQRLRLLAQKVRHQLSQRQYTLSDRKMLILELVEQGAPSIIRFFSDPPKPDPARILNHQQMASLLTWYEFLASHRAFTADATQQVVRHFLDSRGNLLRLLASYTLSVSDIHPDEIAYEKQRDGQYRLSFVYPRLTVHAGLLARDINVEYTAVDCRGTPAEIADYCLLYWSLDDQGPVSPVLATVLATVTGREDGLPFRDWLAWRMEQTGIDDEDEWLQGLWQTGNPDILKILLKKASTDRKYAPPGSVVMRIISNRRMRPDVRADAMLAWIAGAGKDYLLRLTDTLADNTLLQPRMYMSAFDQTFPFFGHVAMREIRLRPVVQPNRTVGMAAYNRLKALTGRDFHYDADSWRKWITDREQ
jgi:hypothetical protein